MLVACRSPMDSLDVYGPAAFAVGAAAGGGLIFLSVVGIAVLLLCCKQCNERANTLAIAMLASFAQMCTTALFAWIAGFGFIAPWVAFLLSTPLWLLVIAFCMVMLRSSWRKAFLITTSKKGDTDEVAGSSCGPLRAAWASLVSSAVSLWRAMWHVTLRNSTVFWVTSMFAFTFSLSMVIALDAVCFCSNPQVVTTWASRRTEAHYCIPDVTCHTYAMLGAIPSKLRIVAHIVSSGQRPSSFSVEVCQVDPASNLCLAGSGWSQPGVMTFMDDILEDLRTVGSVHVTNLTGSTPYRFTASFVTSIGQKTSRTIIIRTVPALDSTEDVVLIGGGDYAVGVGVGLLRGAIIGASDAQVLYVGGDLAYANNMRTCYLRWDEFLHELTILVNKNGRNLPLLTIPGNHESAGYLAVAPSKINFYYQYHPQYDQDFPTPEQLTATYHTHMLGQQLGIVGLDSDLVLRASAQQQYLSAQLEMLRGFSASSPSFTLAQYNAMRFCIVMYHNSVFRGSTAGPSQPTADMLNYITPVIDVNKVPLVLEFHEHIYKRTLPINSKGEVQATGQGTVYIGDGSLGVWSASRQTGNYPYIAKSQASNYINTIRVLANGTAIVTAYNYPSGDPTTSAYDVIDFTTIDKRL